MDLETIKKVIKRYTTGHAEFIVNATTAERYYRNKNDILLNKPKAQEEDTENPLRNADNRIPRNFHGLLVNQKAAYMFTAPPLFDIGSQDANKRITEVLGDRYAKATKDLCINASNCSVAWLHYWKNSEGAFEYGVVDSKQIIPVWTSDLNKKLSGILRVYDELDDTDGELYTIYQYWNDKQCQAFRKKTSDTLDEGLQSYAMFSTFVDNEASLQDTYTHDYDRVPFIPFFNNNITTSDLDNIKKLIDTYDKVYSGFVNDLEDIQEIIFILTGYGGTDLAPFLQDLKKYKTVKLDDDGDNIHSGIQTLTIDIPVEAREKLLDITRKAIFEQGQGVDPQPEAYGNASGVALKYLYSLLELKAGLMETEFKLAFGEFIRAISKYLNVDCKSIIQTWTRTAITNDTELAAIATSSKGTISDKTILKNHPWVEDADQEEKQIKKEQQAAEDEADQYKDTFGQDVNNDGKEK
ncbi:phage portal protein [Anaerocolumna jejuensis]|uniref:phage portal protein n=1 Tax=Anaerocolumna jejuensis TaxID=259063 RepID=UPI003F7BA1DA